MGLDPIMMSRRAAMLSKPTGEWNAHALHSRCYACDSRVGQVLERLLGTSIVELKLHSRIELAESR